MADQATGEADLLSAKQKQRIVDELVKRGALLNCPRCGHTEFTLADGYFNPTLQAESVGVVIGGKSIPTVVTVCTQCGFISLHAIGLLGLLQRGEEKS